jgi:hypothetical protein
MMPIWIRLSFWCRCRPGSYSKFYKCSQSGSGKMMPIRAYRTHNTGLHTYMYSRCCGSVTCWYGYGSAPLFQRIHILLFSSATFKMEAKNYIFLNFLCLLPTFEGTFTSFSRINRHKEVIKQWDQCIFSLFFAWWYKDPDPDQYLWLKDPEGPKNILGSHGSGSGTLHTAVICKRGSPSGRKWCWEEGWMAWGLDGEHSPSGCTWGLAESKFHKIKNNFIVEMLKKKIWKIKSFEVLDVLFGGFVAWTYFMEA